MSTLRTTLRDLYHGLRRNERGSAETLSMIYMVPIIAILIVGAINIGMMFSARLRVENVAQDAVRRVASEGGNHNPRATTLEDGRGWADVAFEQLWDGSKCTFSGCQEGQKPSVSCTPEVADASGERVSCTVFYPYQPISHALLDSPLGMGFGSYFNQPFKITVAGRAETGTQG